VAQIERHAANVDNVLRSIDSASLAELMSIWRSRVPEERSGSPAFFRCLAERILAHGEPLLAYVVVTAGLSRLAKRNAIATAPRACPGAQR
jgi:hypothetical protein